MAIVRITLEWRFVDGSGGLEGHMALVAREEEKTDGEGFVIDGNPSLFETQGWWNGLTGDYG